MRRCGFLLACGCAAGIALTACSPAGTLNALTPRDGFSLDADVSYGALPRQKLAVFRPTRPAPPGGWPVVVFFYGGSWNSGDRADYTFVGAALAERGILTLVADYRLYPAVRYPDFLADSARAVAYGIDQAAKLGGDPARLFVMGHSAGGYNAAMLALDRRWLSATGHAPAALAGWIGLAGPYDFYPIRNPDAKPVFFHPNYPPQSQPVDFVSPGAPPSFLAATRDDDLVNPQRNTVALARKLSAAGVDVTRKLYDRGSHATLIGAFAWPLRWMMPVLDDVTDFIRSTPPAR
ncbi:alpha/beta hydrolase [Comamonadaceae bacterium G21597-S1]|nr:alpha/beta hydrolase [Comamonadaceae bacterium G21597-S1]